MNSLKDKEFQMVGCLGKHASYTFYKSIRIGERTLSLSNFFPVRIWPDSAILSIAEVQLLWKDRNESLCSLRLYFLPENTPFGRFSFHGEDEVIALQDKVIIRASDLMTWIVEEKDWDWGFLTPSCKVDIESNPLSKAFMSGRYGKDEKLVDFTEPRPDSVVVLNYERYVRLRSVLKRLEGSPDIENWLNHPLVMAIGGLAVGPNCRILFARDVFDYPELEDHELLCNHLAPKLKGRPRKKRRARNPSVGSASNESETSSTASCGSTDKNKPKKPLNGLSAHSNVDRDIRIPTLPLSKAAAARMMEEKGMEGSHKEVVFGNNANGLQILKVDSSQMLKNGQISAHGGGMGVKRPYNQGSTNKRVVDSRTSASSSAMAMFDGKHINADMLGPGLSELAQKLKKSNALQILAIRPQLGGRDVGMDYDLLQLKRMKMDPDAELSLRINSDLFIHPLNSGPFTSRKHTIFAAPIIDKVVSKTHDIVKQFVGHSFSQKTSTHNDKIMKIPKPHKQTVVTATIDASAKNAVPTPTGINSPYKTTNQIYVNPGAEKIKAAESRHAKSIGEIIDFSVKRRPNVEISRRTIPTNIPPEAALLDLTVKPVSHGGRQPSYSRGSAEIPAPNVMDKLGLQLTSEVTLFPSPSYMSKVKQEIPHSKSGQSKSVVSMSSASNQNKNHHQESIPGSSRKSRSSPSTSAHSQGGSSMSSRGAPSPKDVHMRHHPQQHHYPNHLNTKSVFGAPDRGPVIPGLSPNQGHSGNAITIKPMTSEEKKAAANLKDLEKAYQTSMHASPFLQPSPFAPPKMDYLSLLANPFLMSPQALMSIPGAMEQFQMYKDLFQQSGIPQFPLQWPPQGPGNDRASK